MTSVLVDNTPGSQVVEISSTVDEFTSFLRNNVLARGCTGVVARAGWLSTSGWLYADEDNFVPVLALALSAQFYGTIDGEQELYSHGWLYLNDVGQCRMNQDRGLSAYQRRWLNEALCCGSETWKKNIAIVLSDWAKENS